MIDLRFALTLSTPNCEISNQKCNVKNNRIPKAEYDRLARKTKQVCQRIITLFHKVMNDVEGLLKPF